MPAHFPAIRQSSKPSSRILSLSLSLSHSTHQASNAKANGKMGSRNRKPLSDITDIHNLTPLSVLRELVSSNGICKPPVSILRSNSNSTNHKFGPESSGRSNTSIGSSSVGATFNSKTVQFRQPPNAVSPTTSPGDIGTKDAAYSRRHNIENSNKEREAQVIVSSTSIEKRKGKGKATAIPFSSSASEKMKETQSRICNMAPTHGGMGIENAAYDRRQTVEEFRKQRKFDVIGCHTHVRKDKGILKRTRSSIVQIKEIGDEYLYPSIVGVAKDRPKFVKTTNFLPEKTKGKGKVILEPCNIRESSAAASVISRPSRKMKTSEKKNNAVGVSSCPPITRTRKLLDDLDEAGDVKYLNSWTDPQANVRKKRCSRTEKTSELPEEFIREQKAYYDDVDNFELPVEEVSQDELD